MKKCLYSLSFTLLLISCGGNQPEEKQPSATNNSAELLAFNDYNQRVSYAIGMDHGFTCTQVYNGENTAGKFEIPEIEFGLIDYLSDKELRFGLSSVDSILDHYLDDNGEVSEHFVSRNDASYAIGLIEAQTLVGSLVGRGIDQSMDIDYLVLGIEAGISGNQQNMTLANARQEVATYYSDINKTLGENFLKSNSQNPNVKVTESGLQYEVIQEGNGIIPNLTDSVLVHYTGRFIDGRVFESTIPSKIPGSFTPLSVIKGWQEGLLLMREGGSARFYIPYQLAYGENGTGPIEPYSTLVYDIELIRVKRFTL